MSAVLEQIKVAFEREEMSPEQIAEAQGLDVVAVKSALAQCSTKYRKMAGQESLDENELNFDNEQLKAANQVIYETMLAAEDEQLRFKAAAYIRDDKKGRKEALKQVASNTFNILTFNEQLKMARQHVNSLRDKLVEV